MLKFLAVTEESATEEEDTNEHIVAEDVAEEVVAEEDVPEASIDGEDTGTLDVPEPPALVEPTEEDGNDEEDSQAEITEEEDDESSILLNQMFPEGIGEYDEGEEVDFQDKYGLGDILGEIEKEDLEPPETDNYEEFMGEGEAPDGPTVEQLEQMIHFLDEQKRASGEAGDDEVEEEYQEGKTTFVEQPEAPDITDPKQKMIMVLGPDHPKMVRFQKALKDHLQRQIYLVETETRDLEKELKEKKRERTELGSAMFNLQNEMHRQTELMEKYDKDLARFTDKRAKTEGSTGQLKEKLKRLRDELECEECRERELTQSMKTLDYSEFVVRQACEKYDGELKIRQFIDEKLEKMKEQSEKQKRDTDFYIDKVMTQVQQMEQINEGIQRQIQAHLEEQKQMTTYINEAITEIEALQIEKIHLQRAWNETISVVRSRDDALLAARRAVAGMEENLRIKESELRSLVRLITKEQESHEHTLILLRRRRVEEKVLLRQIQKIQAKIQRLKDKLSDLQKIKGQIEHELLRLNNMHIKRNKDVIGPRRQIEKLSMEKVRLEDEILLAIQERMAMDKAAEHILLKIKTARDRTRYLDSEVAKIENDMAQLTIDVERSREELLRKQGVVDELEKKLAKQEKVLQEQVRDIKQSERVIQKKTGEVSLLNKRVQQIIKTQGGVEMGPLEQQIEDVKKELQAEKGALVELQEEWLKQQDSLVLLTSQRDNISHQNELLQKEVFIMERKRQRLENELQKKRHEVNKIMKGTEVLRKDIRAMNHKLHKDKFNQEQMDKDNILIQNEVSSLLKEQEMESLELEQEIAKLQDEKERLFATLHDTHEQNLQWEKKVKLAKELKNNIKQEQESSMTGLKLAIHHMQVRFNELSRAQEKLMGDLERSIEQRDTIIQRADLSLKRANIHPTKSKLNVHRTLTQLQERNKHLMKEVKQVEDEVEGLMETITQIEERLHSDNGELDNYKTMITETEEKILEAAVQKHKVR